MSETSWGFEIFQVAKFSNRTLETAEREYEEWCYNEKHRMMILEEEINNILIKAHSLDEELAPEVSEDQISLYRPNREEDIKRFISYIIGCMMGGYSLDKLGLIYAYSDNKGFDPGQYRTFPADEDGIIPLTELAWFEEDAANRFVEFINVSWPKEHLEENLTFVAESLVQNQGELPREMILRCLATGFFKHHLSWQRKRTNWSSNWVNFEPLMKNLGTMPTSGSALIWMTGSRSITENLGIFWPK